MVTVLEENLRDAADRTERTHAKPAEWVQLAHIQQSEMFLQHASGAGSDIEAKGMLDETTV